jgi:hypothetical protein
MNADDLRAHERRMLLDDMREVLNDAIAKVVVDYLDVYSDPSSTIITRTGDTMPMTLTHSLTPEERYQVARSLRVAADVFRVDAQTSERIPRIAESFLHQVFVSEQLAELIETTDSVQVSSYREEN